MLEKNRPQQPLINMAVAEEIGHDHQGKEIFRWDFQKKETNREELWDDIPLILNEAKEKPFEKYTFQVESAQALSKNILVPRYFWQNQIKEIEKLALQQDFKLISIKELIKKGILTFFDGHGSPPAEYKGKGEIPYIRVKDIVNWEVYKDPTAKITEEVYASLKRKDKQLHPEDIVYVRRGSYRIGSVAMVSPYDTEALYTREILVLRVQKLENEYGITPYYLLYLLSHRLVQLQVKNKVLIETTLPNIADRWKELLLPIDNNPDIRKHISDKVQFVIEQKWKAIDEINKIKSEFGDLMT